MTGAIDRPSSDLQLARSRVAALEHRERARHGGAAVTEAGFDRPVMVGHSIGAGIATA
jgi:hypothetical protein